MKKINILLSKTSLVICLCLILFFPILASATTSENYRDVDTSKKVYDYADLFSDSEEAEFKERIDKIINNYNYDVFIVTIDYNDVSYSTSDQSLSFLEDFGDHNEFGLGSKETDLDYNYVAFLIDEDNESIALDVKGEKCFGIYTDARQNTILDAAFNYYADYDNYGTADAFLDYVEKYKNDNAHQAIYDEDGSVISENKNILLPIILTVLKAMFISAILSAIITFTTWKSNHKSVRKAVEATNYVGQNDINITKSDDVFVRHYQTRIKIESSGGSSSSRGGGTHTHRSSSGSRHSGGSRRR